MPKLKDYYRIYLRPHKRPQASLSPAMKKDCALSALVKERVVQRCTGQSPLQNLLTRPGSASASAAQVEFLLTRL